jgi:hypothetical protein
MKVVFIKKCNKCKNEFPPTNEYFSNSKNSKDGLNYACKKCVAKSCRENYIKNREKRLEQSKQYQKENPEKYKESQRKARSKNRDKYNQMVREWQKENREYATAYQKEWQQNNPDKLKGYHEQHRNHDISDIEWERCKEYFKNECVYCGLKEDEHFITYAGELKLTDFHKDHAYHDGENDISNCVPSCKKCNTSKWIYKLDDWYCRKNPIFVEERHNNIIQWLNSDWEKCKSE